MVIENWRKGRKRRWDEKEKKKKILRKKGSG